MGRACCVSPSLKDTIFISGVAYMYFWRLVILGLSDINGNESPKKILDT